MIKVNYYSDHRFKRIVRIFATTKKEMIPQNIFHIFPEIFFIHNDVSKMTVNKNVIMKPVS